MGEEMGKYPRLGVNLETYFKALQHFGKDEQFTTDGLAHKTAKEESKGVRDEFASQYYTHLYQLSMFGIVAFHGAKTFSITLRPTDLKEEWEKKLGERGNSLYENIKELKEKIAPEPKEDYVPVFVGDAPIENMVTYIYNDYDPEKQKGIKVVSRGRFNMKARETAEKIISKLPYYNLEIKDVIRSREPSPFADEEEVTTQSIILESKK